MKKLFFIFLFIILLPFYSFSQNNLIPNTEDCSSTRPKFDFTIDTAWVSKTSKRVDSRLTPLVGDFDGDGNVEIFAASGLAGGANGHVYVFDGKTGREKGYITCPGLITAKHIFSANMAIFKRNASAKGSVFISGYNGYAYLYEVTHIDKDTIIFAELWSRNLNLTGEMRNSPVVADLDGNGTIEIVVAGYILDANTGNTLAPLQYEGKGLTIEVSFPLVAELDNDGLPEIVVGTHVYKYRNNILSLWRVMPGYTSSSGIDGVNIAADINQDGKVDLVFASYISNDCVVTVWTPETGAKIGEFSFVYGNAHSYPFVGDIDGISIGGKKYPEIVINTAGNLRAYTFNGTSFVLKWNMSHSDSSGATSLTLFDFNNDNIVELVYRDETHLHIFDGRGSAPVLTTPSIPCGSATIVETPIIADVTGDGSANIIVTGDPDGVKTNVNGELMVFEGAASKWASCPNVWNQQLYSPLLVNVDLTIPSSIKPPNLTFTRPDNSTVQFYNGGPMQAPYVSEDTFLPVDLSADIYVAGGTLTILSTTSIRLTITYGNAGKAVAAANMPIHYYQNSIATGNIIGTDMLGVDLYPGEFRTITKDITGLSNPLPSRFYVRVMDDGSGTFPPAGAWSDCNLTNNTKSFGTLELFKTVNSQNACIDGTSIFTIKLVNNTDQTMSPETYNNIALTDSLGTGWQYMSCNPVNGTISSAYNLATRKLEWTVNTLVPGDSAKLIITAKSTTAGSIRNTVWVDKIGSTTLGRDIIEAYVIVASQQAPPAASISPTNPTICESGSVELTASYSGANSYQWYKNDVEISGATSQKYTATTTGNYKVTYFDGTCVSQISAVVTVNVNPNATVSRLIGPANQSICTNESVVLTAGSLGVTNPVYRWYTSQTNTIPFHTGVSYTTPNLTATTKYYVSVLGDNYCENQVNNRREVTITVNPNATVDNVAVTGTQTICSGNTTQLTASSSITGAVFKWYSASNTLLHTGAIYTTPALTATTTYHVSVSGTDYCENIPTNRKPVTVTVNPNATGNNITVTGIQRICSGNTTQLTASSDISSAVFKWFDASNNLLHTGAIYTTPALTATTTYHVSVSGTDYCENIPTNRKPVTVIVSPNATLNDIAVTGVQTICSGTTTQLTASSSISSAVFKWFDASNNLLHTGAIYTTPALTATTTYYVSVSGTNYCENIPTNRKPVTVTIRESVFNYPDLRIQACPSTGTINLSKYIDALDIQSLSWAEVSSGGTLISATAGTIDGTKLKFPTTHVYKYTSASNCSGGNIDRLLYLTVLNNKTIGLPPDTIFVCWKNAGYLQINQIFGIEAGGTFSTSPAADAAYVTTNTYGGTIFNGHDAYSVLGTNAYYPSTSINPADAVRIVKFNYQTPAASCLGNTTKTVTIVLTQDLTK